MNVEKLKNWKFWLGAVLVVIFLFAALVLDLQGGFFRNVFAALGYTTAGALAGIVVYYVFLEDKIW
jgi:hypothetical protein